MRKLALKIDVDTYRGTQEGVPKLISTLQAYEAQATFLFSLGPDHTGRAITRAFRPNFLKKVGRTSVLEHYGIKTLLYGTLLPAPNIAKQCKAILQSVAEAGFEVGVHVFDHVRWQDKVASKDAAWTAAEMQLAFVCFERIFGHPAQTHGAAGWQMNREAFRLEQKMQLKYASDTRGSHPFIPVWEAEIIQCPQVPSTLPTLDELIGIDSITSNNVADYILDLTEPEAEYGHVYTLHAELEGMKLHSVFAKLLQGWKKQGYELINCQQLLAAQAQPLPKHHLKIGSMAGRSGTLMLQGEKWF